MPDAVWLLDVLRRAGLPTQELPGARDTGHGDLVGPTHSMVHHTGGNSSARAIQQHPELGLCSQVFLNRKGELWVCGVGIAWHAGQGSGYGLPTNDANRVSLGTEAENNGTEGWSAVQYWAYVREQAAICNQLEVGSDRVVAHKEYAAIQGKWDPGGLAMDKFRADVSGVQRELRGAVVLPTVNQINRVAGFSPWLGAPTSAELSLRGRVAGKVRRYQNGNVYWRADVNRTVPVPSFVLEGYEKYDYENGFLGLPLVYHASSVLLDRDGKPVLDKDGKTQWTGDTQGFEGGAVLRQVGQEPYAVHGKIGDRYAREGWQRDSGLGWPTSDEYTDKATGVFVQDFQNGQILWDPKDPNGTVRVERDDTDFVPN